MKILFGALVTAIVAAASCGSAFAWSHTGAHGSASGGDGSWNASTNRGGSASGSDGSWNASGFRGGSASGGGGSWNAKGADGGTASGGDGSWHATSANGTTAYGSADHYYGGTYSTYHPPTTVNTYYENGCSDCGGWNAAGAAAVGVAAGTVIGAASANAATSNAYAAGVAAGSSQYPVGSIYTTLPAGCAYDLVGNVAYYKCGGGVWLTPASGANGVYYRVTPAP